MPKLTRWLAAIVVIWPVAAQAQDTAPARLYLWRDLYAGMTLAELKSLYPGFKGALSPDCPVRVLSRYKKGKLVSVILLGRDRDGPCSDRLMAELNGQYGEGTVEYRTQSTIPILGIVSSFQRRDIVWKPAGKLIVLSLMPGKPPGYNLAFAVRDEQS